MVHARMYFCEVVRLLPSMPCASRLAAPSSRDRLSVEGFLTEHEGVEVPPIKGEILGCMSTVTGGKSQGDCSLEWLSRVIPIALLPRGDSFSVAGWTSVLT